MGIVVSQLKNCVEYYNREKHAYDLLLRQRNSLLTSLHLNTKGNESNNVRDKVSILILNIFFADQQQYESLNEKLSDKKQELKYCIFLTENCLYLLWAHLDFFMLRAISVSPLQLNSPLGGLSDGNFLRMNFKPYFFYKKTHY